MSIRETDPRAVRTRETVLSAAKMLLATEGPGALTHQRVAEAAGVGRATLYRHWPDPEDLFVLATSPPSGLTTLIGDESIRTYLIDMILRFGACMREPSDVAALTTMMQRGFYDHASKQRRDQFHDSLVADIDSSLKIAAKRGDVKTRLRADYVLEQTAGPVMFRALIVGRVIDRKYASRLADFILLDTAG